MTGDASGLAPSPSLRQALSSPNLTADTQVAVNVVAGSEAGGAHEDFERDVVRLSSSRCGDDYLAPTKGRREEVIVCRC